MIAEMKQIDGGGSGKAMVRVAVAGEVSVDGGDVVHFVGVGQQLRRSFGVASLH